MPLFKTSSLLLIGLLTVLLSTTGCSPNRHARNTVDGTADTLLKKLTAKRVLLPNGWSLASAGRSLPLGDLPLNMALSPSKKWLAVTNNGQSRQTIILVDVAGEKVLDEVEIPKSWLGIRFSADERFLYASGGNDNLVAIFRLENNRLLRDGEIKLGEPWPKDKISVAGIEIDPRKNLLFAVTKEDSALYTCDLNGRKVLAKTKLPTEPYTCLLAPDGKELYITLWGHRKVATYDVTNARISGEVAVQSHPNDMALGANGKTLFVANANDNSVSVIDVAARRVIETISAALYPQSPTGSTTNGVALSEDGRRLYIANADNNCLAVFDVTQPGKSQSLGYIPTDWYPTAVKVAGKRIFVSNGKGGFSMANPKGPNPLGKVRPKGSNVAETAEKVQYIAGLFKGTLSIIDEPEKATLSTYSKVVYANTPYSKKREAAPSGEPGNPIPRKVGEASPIQYVFYVIKENRTYDQVFGDMPDGNGDSALCLFPEKITPNQHALAREFGLFDNFYVDAEVSADGHNWSTAAYATDYVEKTWPTSYGARGGTYDYEGSREVAFPKNGYIWDYCRRAGISYRSYGEFTPANDESFVSQGLASLKGHYPPAYPNYDLSIKDVYREKVWERDFDSLVARNAVPRFNSIRLGNDHTSGARVGKRTPFAMVADNDLALGRLIDHLSKSKIWKQSAVFVLEDDAQNGADHVDAHRSPVLVISPYAKRRSINHTMYSTASVLRTMELILGLPPMSQYDAAATPMWDAFTSQPTLTGYQARPSQVDLEQKNLAYNEDSRQSEGFDWSKPDRVPDRALSEIIWRAVKGSNSPVPAPRRSAFVRLIESEPED
jgi:YVTN family beta-propeller protein